MAEVKVGNKVVVVSLVYFENDSNIKIVYRYSGVGWMLTAVANVWFVVQLRMKTTATLCACEKC